MKYQSEFRKDIISGGWILVVPGRAKKPGDIKKKGKKRIPTPIRSCRFERPFENVDENVILGYTRKKSGDIRKDWDLLVLKNKYPAVIHSSHKEKEKSVSRFSSVIPGTGHHDLIITRDHNKNFSMLSREKAFRVLSAFRDRYLMLFADKNISHISMFHNWGGFAGASIYHPHYQMLAIPIIPPGISRTLEGAKRYFIKKKKCPYCDMIAFEKKEKKRIVCENEEAIAFAPYASKNEFQVNVFPKKHSAFFENTDDFVLEKISFLLQDVLKRVTKNLGDPDYNFLIHTSPVLNKKKNTKFFHWHIEVRPVWNISAGFEHDTGMEVNVIDPDFAAKTLKK